jgi:hypothetical protein
VTLHRGFKGSGFGWKELKMSPIGDIQSDGTAEEASSGLEARERLRVLRVSKVAVRSHNTTLRLRPVERPLSDAGAVNLRFAVWRAGNAATASQCANGRWAQQWRHHGVLVVSFSIGSLSLESPGVRLRIADHWIMLFR